MTKKQKKTYTKEKFYKKCWGCYFSEGIPEKEAEKMIERKILSEGFVRKKIVNILKNIKKILVREKSAWERELGDLEDSILRIFRKEKITQTKKVIQELDCLLEILEYYIQSYSYPQQK